MPDVSESHVAQAKVLYLSGITLAISLEMRAAAFHAIDIARLHGTQVSLDLNYRPALWSHAEALVAINEAVSQSDIVFPSDDETPDAIADRFLAAGAKVVLTKGPRWEPSSRRPRSVCRSRPSRPTQSTPQVLATVSQALSLPGIWKLEIRNWPPAKRPKWQPGRSAASVQSNRSRGGPLSHGPFRHKP